MQCPACSGPTKAIQTHPARNRSDGRVYRLRRCVDSACNTTCSTLEAFHHEVVAESLVAKEAEAAARRQPPAPAIPIAAPAPTMYDLEGELEKGLPLAVECILDAVKPKTSPDKVKLDAAKWLIDDRRRWRIQTAEQANRAGEVPADPAMAQLAGILRLVPDQEVG
jgi:hypothetical protein